MSNSRFDGQEEDIEMVASLSREALEISTIRASKQAINTTKFYVGKMYV